MMKKILAAAIVSAFAAPAFAATANVDIYGAFRGSVDFVDADGFDSRTRVSSNNSRIGFKGTEDLGGGLSAIWQWEYAFQLDQQSATNTFQNNSDTQGSNSSRHTFVGLSSKTLGALTLGTQESPLKTSTGPLAVFNDTLADYRSVFTKLSTRSDNSVMYTSPTMTGLTLRLMGGARNESGTAAADDADMYAASVVYSNGPLYATLAYEANDVAGGAQNDAWRAGVGYTFGNTKLGLAYEDNDAENAAGSATNDGSAWYVSVAHKMGNITLAAAYTDRDEYTSGANNGAKQWTAGMTYSLSKRTELYALYTEVKNDTNGSNNIGAATGIATVSTVAGGDAQGISLGLNHSF
ncbi:MAG: porin [Thiobacillus sp.]|nr:porin [Thiobacillus sp.]